MNEAKQEILARLQKTVHPVPEQPDFDAPVYHSIEKSLEITFKENLENVNGSVYLCSSEKDLFSQLKTFLSQFPSNNIYSAESKIKSSLEKYHIPFTEYKNSTDSIEVSITGCEFLIAQTGSAMVSSAQKGGRRLFVAPSVHIVIASKSQIVGHLKDAYSAIQEKYKENLPSLITLITGPSRTADIEKTLILGAHGPKELHVFINETPRNKLTR